MCRIDWPSSHPPCASRSSWFISLPSSAPAQQRGQLSVRKEEEDEEGLSATKTVGRRPHSALPLDMTSARPTGGDSPDSTTRKRGRLGRVLVRKRDRENPGLDSPCKIRSLGYVVAHTSSNLDPNLRETVESNGHWMRHILPSIPYLQGFPLSTRTCNRTLQGVVLALPMPWPGGGEIVYHVNLFVPRRRV